MERGAEAYIRDRFVGARVILDPFPHLIVRDVLPDTVYRAMETALPGGARWKLAALEAEWRLRGWKHTLACAANRRRTISQPYFGVREPDRSHGFGLGGFAELWRAQFGDYVALVDQLTIAAFTSPIASYRERLAADGIPLGSEIRLGQSLFCQRGANWDIQPHTHGLAQIIQSMIYFPVSGSHEDQGTVLYNLRASLRIEARQFGATRPFTDKEAERALVLPYQRNSLVSFINTPEAVHSTNPVEGPPRRYIFSCMEADIALGEQTIIVGGEKSRVPETEASGRVGA
jgi:hypothetical protein